MARSRIITRAFWAAECLAFVGALVLAVRMSYPAEWEPALLVVLLLVLALGGDRLSSPIGNGVLSTAHTAMVLTICLLGPSPAVLFGFAAAVLTSAVRRLHAPGWLNNLSTFTLYPLAGAGIVAVHDRRRPRPGESRAHPQRQLRAGRVRRLRS